MAERVWLASSSKSPLNKTGERRGIPSKAKWRYRVTPTPYDKRDLGELDRAFGKMHEGNVNRMFLVGDEPYRIEEDLVGNTVVRVWLGNAGEATQSFEVPNEFPYTSYSIPISPGAEIHSGSAFGTSAATALAAPDELENLRTENQQLSLKLELLKSELRKNVPSLQLYRFGAGTFSLSVISLLTWVFAGVGIPFHPMFAAAMFPVGPVFMAMAWLTRKKDQQTERES